MKFSYLIVTLALGIFTISTMAAPFAQTRKKQGTRHRALAAASPAKAKTVVFDVAKMHCQGCASGLIQAATKWPGVKKADVSFRQKRALVTFDPKKTNAAKIAAEFTRVGFPAKAVS